ncbi:hypothetical protein BD626DRAFT_207007 [Schizophyllum amplum]|uniref:Uncharacterized protein n=1 Tax=Schizophyllum amplum TaxID=97359 RepID=A0A550BYT7_9AGAR|nr:hypothetical protein BD626DRAFT_207007 [Auriculariopsis ampla]
MAKKSVFESVIYHLSPSFRSSRRVQLQAALEAQGARPAALEAHRGRRRASVRRRILSARFDGRTEAKDTAEIVTDASLHSCHLQR